MNSKTGRDPETRSLSYRNRSMTASNHNCITKEEVAHLAFLNWQKDGCPSGRDLNYWIEAESQLKATKHLMAEEHSRKANPERNALAAPMKTGKPKTRRATARKLLAR
jgi:hypothetical protein